MIKYPQIVDKINRVFKDVPVCVGNGAVCTCLNMQVGQIRAKLLQYLYCNNMR